MTRTIEENNQMAEKNVEIAALEIAMQALDKLETDQQVNCLQFMLARAQKKLSAFQIQMAMKHQTDAAAKKIGGGLGGIIGPIVREDYR